MMCTILSLSRQLVDCLRRVVGHRFLHRRQLFTLPQRVSKYPEEVAEEYLVFTALLYNNG